MSTSKIEWVLNPDSTPGFSWNPVVGCEHNCSYCYAREIARRFPAKPWPHMCCNNCVTFTPHTHWERKLPRFRKPATVFIGAMTDLWGDWVPAEWIQRVLDMVASRPQDVFLTLTKAPWNYHKFPTLPNLWYGVTVDYGHTDVLKITATMRRLQTTKAFLSFEPVLSDPQAQCIDMDALKWYQIVIVGPLNHRGPAVTRREWVEHIVKAAESAGVPVFMKNKCLDPRAFVDGKCFTESEMRRELPWVKK